MLYVGEFYICIRVSLDCPRLITKKAQRGTRDVAQLVEYLLSTRGDQAPSPLHKPGCNSGNGEVETEESEVQSHLPLPSESEDDQQ